MRTTTRGRFLCVVALSTLPSCGARTALDDGSVDINSPRDAAISTQSGCGAPDPEAPLVVGADQQSFGSVAASGCSFAMTWQENLGDGFTQAARTVQVVGGAWTLSPPITVASPTELDSNANQGFIGWDGAGYTVAWTDDGTLFLRRMSADGTLLGPRVRSVEVGPDSYVSWIDPSPTDGTLRIGLMDDRKTQFLYHAYFLKVALDGTAVVPAVDLTPNAESADIVGFAHLPNGDNRLFWTDGNDVSGTFSESFFDDLGNATQPAAYVLPPVNAEEDSYLGGGVAVTSADVYFGVLHSGPDRVVVGLLNAAGSGYSAVTGTAGADAPSLAATDTGVLGVLVDRTGGANVPSDLLLSFVKGTSTTATEVIAPNDATSDNYGIAAGSSSFGVFWESATSDLKFTVRAP
jgi:hypothetical protein